jgi:hypothetical protein
VSTLAQLLAISALAMVACGGQAIVAGDGGSAEGGAPGEAGPAPSVVVNAGSTIAFDPGAVETKRYPTPCGTPDAPFMDGDLFSVGIVPSGPATPYGLLSVTYNSPQPVGVPTALTVSPLVANGSQSGTTVYPVQTAKSGSISLVYSQGTGTGAIDTGAFDSVGFTLLAMPAKDGDPLTVRLQIHFADGKVLDETYSGAVVTDTAGCLGG